MPGAVPAPVATRRIWKPRIDRAAEEAAKAPAMKAAAAAADEATVCPSHAEVQQISAENPAAGKLLLDELSRSKPKLWPLVVQQFRSEQAFHDQLLAKAESSQSERTPKRPLDVASNDPPSEEVGQLTDPRGIRSGPGD